MPFSLGEGDRETVIQNAANKRTRLEAGLSTGEVELNKMLSESEKKLKCSGTVKPKSKRGKK